MTKLSDIVLFNEIKKGNKIAFDTLFRLYYAQLVAYASKTIELEEAENIVQDVFLYIWENRKKLQVTNISSYLYTSVKNKTFTFISHGLIKEKVHYNIADMQTESGQSDEFLFRELNEKMEYTLSQMRIEYKEAFELNRFYNKSYKEIADIKNVSTKTIDFRIQQALKTLRAALKDYAITHKN